MAYLQQLYFQLQNLAKQEFLHYAIPSSWNRYGYQAIATLRNNQILVNPFDFYEQCIHHLLFHYENKKEANWLKQARIYTLNIQVFSAWDHDRDEKIKHDNLDHLSDSGTFLKTIILLPYLKQLGINTILLEQLFKPGKSERGHHYAHKQNVCNFHELNEQLCDPLLPNMNVYEQYYAFLEACELYGFHIILSYCPGKMAINNDYLKDHPQWFYWIKKDAIKDYHVPTAYGLPRNCLADNALLKRLYQSDDVKEHLAMFVDSNEADKVVAPYFEDQINGVDVIDYEATIPRFYLDKHDDVPKDVEIKVPYLLQDVMRGDLHQGKIPNQELWDLIIEEALYYQNELKVDGLYIEKPNLLPKTLHQQLIEKVKKNDFVMIAQEENGGHGQYYEQLGYDAISGSSGYEGDQSALKGFQIYLAKRNKCKLPVFACCEFYDSKRIAATYDGKKRSILYHIINMFSPRGIFMMMNGAEAFEKQPCDLSVYGDSRYVNCLERSDLRYRRQAYLDEYYFDYTSNDLPILSSILEPLTKIREKYVPALFDEDKWIMLQYEASSYQSIVVTYQLEHQALMMIANTDLNNRNYLKIDVDCIASSLSFKIKSAFQIYSSFNSFKQDIMIENNKCCFDLAGGEVVFVEIVGEENVSSEK